MKISVALATYNGETFLLEQLNSLVRQRRLPDELIVSDDASTDATRDIIRAFSRTAPFSVTLLENDHRLGYVDNFSRALSLCSGDLVFLCDQDDVWYEDKIAVIAEFARRDDKGMCFMNDALLADDSLSLLGMSKWQQIRAAGLTDEAFVMGCCVAVRRTLLDLALPIPQAGIAHDNWLVGMADSLSVTRRNPTVLQYYRRHADNTSDFFVNQAQAFSPWKRIRRALTALPGKVFSGESLEREWAYRNALLMRFEQYSGELRDMLGEANAHDKLVAMRKYLKVLESRKAVRALSVPGRPSQVLKLWREGAYKESGGGLGAIKDLFLARSGKRR